MASNDRKQQVTMLNRDSKILLLTILKQGYITKEQKQAFSSLLGTETYEMVYISKREDFEEVEKMYQKIEGLQKERNEAFEERGYIRAEDFSHDAIKEALNANLNTEQ